MIIIRAGGRSGASEKARQHCRTRFSLLTRELSPLPPMKKVPTGTGPQKVPVPKLPLWWSRIIAIQAMRAVSHVHGLTHEPTQRSSSWTNPCCEMPYAQASRTTHGVSHSFRVSDMATATTKLPAAQRELLQSDVIYFTAAPTTGTFFD